MTPLGAPRPWHPLPLVEVWAGLECGPEGLTTEEADRRLATFGPNALPTHPPRPAWRVLLDQVRSLVFLLLTLVAIVAFLTGEVIEAAAVAVVVVINVALGFTMEWRARRSMDALKKLQVAHAWVLRDGEYRVVDSATVVPGDVVRLRPGDAVPADARVVESLGLSVDEALLTGESVPVAKAAVDPPASREPPPIGERAWMIHKGTLVTRGKGSAVVIGTGTRTELGRIDQLMAQLEEPPSPLERRLDAMGRSLILLVLGIVAVVSGLGILRGQDVIRMLETGLALAVAAVPEGLPVVATIALAVGMRRMARRNALLRRLPAVEALGGATVICTDKTGTVTTGEMTVVAIWTAEAEVIVSGVGYHPDGSFEVDGAHADPAELAGLIDLLTIGALAHDSFVTETDGLWSCQGDPTECAILTAAMKAGLDPRSLATSRPRLGEIEFTSRRMWMATLHGGPGGGEIFVKGAPHRVIPRCARVASGGADTHFTPRHVEDVEDANRRFASRGLRVLALARRDVSPGPDPFDDAHVRDLTLVGLVAMHDAPAPGVREAVERCRSAGIRTLMLTGDQAPTARAIAGELGMDASGEGFVEAAELHDLGPEETAARLDGVVGLARVGPEDKLRIVEALQARGEVVAMLGDGVNDAPALRRADIGVAMGLRGTDVAREAADLVLQDDRFETITAAVEEGRVIYDNIRKFILYLFSCNLAEVGVIFAASVSGLPQPVLPLQILWLNLITDVFPALALAMEPPALDVMRRPPRDPRAPILSRTFLGAVFWYGGVLTASTLAAFSIGLRWGTLEQSVTMAFMALAFTQLLHVFNARSVGPLPLARVFTNPWMWGALLLSAALQLSPLANPFLGDLLDVVAIPAWGWVTVAATAVAPLVVGQAASWIRKRETRPRSDGPGAGA
ncbi:MAG: cation-translocating P-type ATPase [Gemmatimonadota bacterium]|nr:cation-translocating P-type ATPase [Gemmatimonadota bacterium]